MCGKTVKSISQAGIMTLRITSQELLDSVGQLATMPDGPVEYSPGCAFTEVVYLFVDVS